MSLNIESGARPEDQFIATFEQQVGRTLNGNNTRLHELRQDAIRHFSRLGFPTRKSESWKYTDIEKVIRNGFTLHVTSEDVSLTKEEINRLVVPGLDTYVAVLLNGRFRPDLSTLEGLPQRAFVGSLAEAATLFAAVVDRHLARYADHTGEVFTALNTAFTQDGLFVYLPEGTMFEQVLQVVNLVWTENDAIVQPRNLVVAEGGSSVRMVEVNYSLTNRRTFTNSVSEFFVGEKAHVDFYRIQDEGEKATQVAGLQVHQEEGSYFLAFTATLSGNVVRNNVGVRPDAEHCESHLLGLFLGTGSMHVDNHTLVDHAKPQCFSNETYKGILDDEATGVFNGKVFVRPDAQQTNAYQSNKSIVLTEKAQMYSKPELEIYADDVKCSHGATTGQLDPEALFYLRSRGLTEKRARAMMLRAFAHDVIEQIKLEPLVDLLDLAVEERYHE